MENVSIDATEKPRQDRSKGKAMLELFFSWNGIVHMKFITEGATVNKTRKKKILGRLRDSIRRRRSELWRRKNWLLLTTAPLHIALFLSKRNLQGNRSPFSHNLNTYLISHHSIFVSFPAWKHSYMGVNFIRPKRPWLPQKKLYGTFLPTCFSGASSSYTNVDTWQTCIAANGDYFEGECGSV